MSVYYLLETLTSPDQAGLETRSCLGVGAGFISVSERFGSVGQEFGLDRRSARQDLGPVQSRRKQ